MIAPRLSVGGLFVEALAPRDFATLACCLDTSVRLRALLPRGPFELAGRDRVATWFRSLFGGPEAVRLAVNGVAKSVACATCPPIPELFERYERAGGRYLVCPICVDAKQIDKGDMLPNAEIGGTVVMWQWIGDDGATTFSY